MKWVQILSIPVVLAGTGWLVFTGIAHSGNFPDTVLQAENPVGERGDAIAQAGATAPPITTTSGPAEVALARHLKNIGAKMYGAYWCPHCHEQMAAFGRQAALQVPYIECAEDGKNARPDLCKAANIEGYPTWKIKGQTLTGTQSLEELATASGYRGSRSFKSSSPKQ
ncbi:hypothetical protein K9N68_14415 [Kovacikia minuta CCNUW1]|uniref:hypothetical protein n=1 Tax=Kovacikia minuta TaxID=2931930 RepID=UPI001CCC32FE|nr:hypothetical protein [Kovacikia minuta]UBF28924.1 hypothetical protein K9N68_14415 [Kovacikia minuta CCNUW1]